MEMPNPGDVVITMSGNQIGRVIVALNGRIHVHTGGATVWLPEDAIFESGFGKVRLVCEDAGIRTYGSVPQPVRSGTNHASVRQTAN